MNNNEIFSAEIELNSTRAQKKLEELGKELLKQKENLQNLTKEGSKATKQEIKQARAEIKKLEKQTEYQSRLVDGLSSSMKELSTMSYDKLEKSLNALIKGLKSGKIEKGSKEWDIYKKRIEECRDELDKFKVSIKSDENLFSKTVRFANKNWGAITQGFAAITGISATIRRSVNDYAEMEQKMADVRKYTGQTDEQVREMNEDFKKMDTRTSREQLNELAGAAGRLGLTAKEDIEEFVDAANKIGVALGDDLGKDAVDTIGKLAIAFGESDRLGLRQAMLASGSALNDIVQNSSAQAQPVVEFTKALSGVGQQAHMTQAQIMGFASALDQNNQEMATSSTVMSQLITKMYQDPAKFAKMAGLDVQKFSELIKKDMNEALLTWFKASRKLGDMSVLAGAFDGLGMDGTRAVGVLSTLAGHIDQVAEAQRIANEAYEEATSVGKEYEIQEGTVQAAMEKAKKAFKEVTIELGEKLQPMVKYTISGASMLTKAIYILTDFVMKHSSALLTLIGAIGTYIVASKAEMAVMTAKAAISKAYGAVMTWLNTQAIAYTAATSIQTHILNGNMLTHKNLRKVLVENNVIIKSAVAVTSLLKAAYYAVTMQISKAGRAMTVFNAVIRTNPWGIAATAIIAATAAIAYFVVQKKKATKAAEENEKAMKREADAQKTLSDVQNEASAKFAEEKTRIETLSKTIKNGNKSIDERKKAILALKKIIPDYHASISKEGKLINENTNAIKDYIQKLRAVATAQAAFEKLTELNKQKMEAELKAQRKQTNVKAVEREIERGLRTGEYREGDQTVGKTYGIAYWENKKQDNLPLRKKKEELSIQQEALDKAKEEVKTIDTKIKTVEKWISKNKDYQAAYSNVVAGGSGFVNTGLEGSGKTAIIDETAQKKAAETAKANYQSQIAEEMLSYRQGKISYTEYLDNKHALTEKYYEKIKAIYGKDSNEYKKLLDEKEKEEQEYTQTKIKRSEDALLIEKMQRDHSINMAFYDKSNKEAYQNQETLQENLFRSEIEYLRKKQSAYFMGSKEWEDYERQIKENELKHKLQLEEGYQKKLLEYRKEFSLVSVEEQEQIELDGVKALYDILKAEGKMTEEEYNKIVRGIKNSFREMKEDMEISNSLNENAKNALEKAEKRAGIEDTGNGGDIVSIVGNAMSIVEQREKVNKELEKLYQEDAINHEVYEEAKAMNSRRKNDDILAYTTSALGEINSMLGAVSAYMQACSDLETAKIKKNYEAQINAAGNNSKKREKLEKQRDEEIRKAKTKENKKAMTIEIAQAIASTAMAAINAYSSAAAIPVSGWILAPIAAGLATAAGMLQIATIKKQHQAEQAGYYSGGYTGGKNYRKEAGVVHEGEFVANHDAVNNSRIAPVFELLDRAQRTNRVGSLTAKDVTNVMGGPASAAIVPVVNIQTSDEDLKLSLEGVTIAIDNLNNVLSEPIEAKISMQHLDKEWKRYNNLLKAK